jgi:CRISPR-associated protein Cmr2
MILSYLSQRIIEEVNQNSSLELISPGTVKLSKGVPNRILIKGEYTYDSFRDCLGLSWRRILRECRGWIERNIPGNYQWERDWELWGAHTWEVFHGQGDSITAAMNDLEANKLCRAWVGVNWIGESSSLSGSDAIAWPGLGARSRNPKTIQPSFEDKTIKAFYTQLSLSLENSRTSEEPTGKFLDDSERLSIPELVKRLVTHYQIAGAIGIPKIKKFSDIQRKPDPDKNLPGQWTAWFMGDGDKVGDHLKCLATIQNPQAVTKFSQAMARWGENFEKQPPPSGRIIYAGGDDFLGIIYNTQEFIEKNPDHTQGLRQTALTWLMGLNDTWKSHEQTYIQDTGHKKKGDLIGLSVGFVWAGHSVPQRDVLQHCREAETQAKNAGRDRVALRVLFNNGQHVQWITPWDWLPVLTQYRDRSGGNNWAHIYGDWADLKARHAVEPYSTNPNRRDILEREIALALFERYFNRSGQTPALLCDADTVWGKKRQHLLPEADKPNGAIVDWINDLIEVGWHLCRDLDLSSAVTSQSLNRSADRSAA